MLQLPCNDSFNPCEQKWVHGSKNYDDYPSTTIKRSHHDLLPLGCCVGLISSVHCIIMLTTSKLETYEVVVFFWFKE